jgi:glucosamine kinase
VSIYLGIDGGGSKTVCVLGNEKATVSSGVSGPSNVVRVGEQRARQSIAEAVDRACYAASVNPSQVEWTCMGAAGGARPETAEIVRRILREIVGGEIEVVGDMVIALEAALGSGPGVVVISGTGSIAYGRNANGQTARAGGWGYAISDEGSGHWIGRTAVSTIMLNCDAGREPALLAHFLRAWRLQTREQLIMTANSPKADFAGLVPAIVAAAQSADPIAHSILMRAGVKLATLAKAVITQLFPDGESPQVAMAGGVFGNAGVVRQVFYNNLRAAFPNVRLNQRVVHPVEGAFALARKAAKAAGT